LNSLSQLKHLLRSANTLKKLNGNKKDNRMEKLKKELGITKTMKLCHMKNHFNTKSHKALHSPIRTQINAWMKPPNLFLTPKNILKMPYSSTGIQYTWLEGIKNKRKTIAIVEINKVNSNKIISPLTIDVVPLCWGSNRHRIRVPKPVSMYLKRRKIFSSQR
jgi:hypothetical protein